MKTINFFPISLGCVKNQVDFEYLFSELKNYKWSIVNNKKNADIIIINTCAFINDAKEESINEILKALKNKSVLITGCLYQRYGEQLIKLFPEIKFFIGTEAGRFAKEIDKAFRNNTFISTLNTQRQYIELKDRVSHSNFHTYIKISEGCDRNCTFCIIPKIRGIYRSRRIESIVNEIKKMYVKGYREFNIISEDTSLYGMDIYKKRMLITLIEKLNNINYQDIIFRLLYVYPDEYIFQTIDAVYNNKKFTKYIDIPIQHVSKHILKKMNRVYIDPYKIGEYMKEKHMIFRTSVIIGFPGETEKDIEQLKQFISNGYIDKLGIFKYSNEEDTVAYKLKNKVHYKTIEKRYNDIIKIYTRTTSNKMLKEIGKIRECVFYERVNNLYIGRFIEDLYGVDDTVIAKGRCELYKKIKVKIISVKDMQYIGECI